MKLIDSPYSLSLTQERRHGRRRKVDSIVYVNIGGDNGGVLLDLSESGMCISVANPLAVSSEIRFALRLDEGQPVQGAGKVSWLSESGRSAGVQFSYFPNESRMRIRQWLAGTGGLTKNTEPTAVAAAVPPAAARNAAAATAPAFGGQVSAQPETETPADASIASEAGERRSVPQTPLFFLPKRPAADEIYDELASQPGDYTWHPERTGTESEGERVESFRSAIISQPERDEETSPEGRRFKKTVIVLTVCFALLAGCAASIVAYPKRFSELRQFTASLTTSLTAPSADTSTTPAEPARPTRRIRRRVARRPIFVAKGPQRGSHPVRDSAVFDAPRDNSTAFSVTATDSSDRRWLASASGRRLVPNDAPSATPAAAPDSTSLPGGNGAPVAADPQASAPTTEASLQPPAQLRNLRVDGGLVEEGAVSPTFAPLNLDGQTLDSKPIVVEAVIGKDGGVQNVRLVNTPSSKLAQAVVSAVKLWRYRPFYRNGQPIEFVTRITFDFSLPEANP